jgi:hypothetical protein
VARTETKRVAVRPGIEIAPVHEPLRVGDPSRRLRVISTRMDEDRYVARLVGLAGRTYRIRAFVPFATKAVAGADVLSRGQDTLELAVTFAGEGGTWTAKDLVITVGSPTPSAPRR